MDPTIAPINITSAALTAQVFLLIIMFIGAAILHVGSDAPFHKLARPQSGSGTLSWVILLFALLTVVPLIFSSDFSTTWRPLFGGAYVPVLASSKAMFLMFTFDIICVAILVGLTDGCRHSAFTAIYFVLPALAIFLREPFSRVLLYTAGVTLLFMFQLSWFPDSHRGSYGGMKRTAYGIVSVLCVLLTTVIGYVTRPR